ncbi:MAG: transketolase C-terminal domain-containing protein [Parachlamydiales bacterium]|jgi:transketolase
MRNAFAEEITNLAANDPRIVLLSGDIGNKLFDNFKKFYPDRFYNCGVAEANMTGIAAGLAMNNFRPITYTIASFNTIRCLEQIKLDVCYHNVPVIIVGVGAGLSYSSLGGSHHACDDLAFLRTIPNMIVTCPADSFEVKKILREGIKLNRPMYLRIGKKGEPLVHAREPDLSIGKGLIVKDGEDVCLFATGNLVYLALKIAENLKESCISIQVVSMHTIKPLDTEMLINSSKKFPLIVSLEEHYLNGGLGSSIAECFVDHQINCSMLRFGISDVFPSKLGSQEYLRDCYKLNLENITTKIKQHLKKEVLCEQKLPY